MVYSLNTRQAKQAKQNKQEVNTMKSTRKFYVRYERFVNSELSEPTMEGEKK